jgi:hypothetical protein
LLKATSALTGLYQVCSSDEDIKLAERTKAGFNNLTQSGALSSIIVESSTPGKFDRVFDQKQITDNVYRAQLRSFGQAHGTPFTVESLINSVGWHGTSESFNAILDGTVSQEKIATC